MFGAGKAEKHEIALPDHIGNGCADLDALAAQPRQRFRRQIERDDALAALLTRLRQIGSPITPRPMKPIVL